MKSFSQLNPVVEFIYFLLSIGFSVFIMNPACLCISLITSLICAFGICGAKKAGRNVLYSVPMIALAALMNPAFNHEGATILSYLPSGNPLTLESIAYGAAAGIMIAAVMCHFSCFNAVMTADKLTYLTGRISPSLSMLFSMTLRLVPKLKIQLDEISMAQRGIGKDIGSDGLVNKIKNGARIMAILVNRSLEESVETADSMKSRGYGLPGKSAFSMYRMDVLDRIIMYALAAGGAYIIYACSNGYMAWQYFPVISGVGFTAQTTASYAVYALIMLIPAIMNLSAQLSYKYRISKIEAKNENI